MVLVVALVSKLGVDYYTREDVKKERKFEKEIKDKGSNQGLLGGASYGDNGFAFVPNDDIRGDSSELDVIIPQQ